MPALKLDFPQTTQVQTSTIRLPHNQCLNSCMAKAKVSVWYTLAYRSASINHWGLNQTVSEAGFSELYIWFIILIACNFSFEGCRKVIGHHCYYTWWHHLLEIAPGRPRGWLKTINGLEWVGLSESDDSWVSAVEAETCLNHSAVKTQTTLINIYEPYHGNNVSVVWESLSWGYVMLIYLMMSLKIKLK